MSQRWGTRPALKAVATTVGVATVIGTGVLAVRAERAEHETVAVLKEQYRRPDFLTVPKDNPLTPAKVALGQSLFNEPRLSLDNSKSCASCHIPTLAFTDGVAIGEGVRGRKPARHTPHLWNLAWAQALFWDGRATTLEQQARGPIENPNEMGQSLTDGVAKIAGETSYKAGFAAAFPDDPRVSEENALRALATYERTLVSPATRFDRWIDGDETGLSDEEVNGFVLFNGKAGCASCHSGWAFTDHAFHDIGLPGTDRGRGPIIDLAAVDHAFKTPSLRELIWTAPYMHDGSLSTIDDVLTHYERGGEARPSRSPDMPNTIGLDESERQSLLAFLETLSSERPPRPSFRIEIARAASAAPNEAVVATSHVSQRNKLFIPASISVAKGATLTIINDDKRPHNVRIHDPRLKYDTGLQEPGDKAMITLPQTGIFEAFCGIHPNMRLTIEVK